MSNKHSGGFTLVEMIVAMVIISVGIAGVLGVLANTSVFSTDPMVTKQLTAIAEGMMEEIQLKPFTGPGTSPPSGCARTAFDEVSDYNNYNQAVCEIDGTPGAAGYQVQVTISGVTGDILLNGVAPADAVRIEVLVTHGNDRYSLVGWRNNYGIFQP